MRCLIYYIVELQIHSRTIELSGNEVLHIITKGGWYQLRIDLEDFNNNTRYALYRKFAIGPGDLNYKLTVDGYIGNAGTFTKQFFFAYSSSYLTRYE